MPMPAMTTRSLAGGRPSLPRAEAGMTQGKATRAAEALRNARRLTAGFELGLWFMSLFVHFLQGRFRFVAEAVIGGFVHHSLQGFPGDRRLTACERFGDFFVSREGLALQLG